MASRLKIEDPAIPYSKRKRKRGRERRKGGGKVGVGRKEQARKDNCSPMKLASTRKPND